MFDIRSLMLVQESCTNWDHVSSRLIKEHSNVIGRKRPRSEATAADPWHGGASAAAASAASESWLGTDAIQEEIDRLSTELPIDREAVKALHRLAAADAEDS